MVNSRSKNTGARAGGRHGFGAGIHRAAALQCRERFRRCQCRGGAERENCLCRRPAQPQLWGIAFPESALRTRATRARPETGKPHRVAAARHDRLSRCILGFDPLGRCLYSAQYASHTRTVSLHARRQSCRGDLCLRAIVEERRTCPRQAPLSEADHCRWRRRHATKATRRTQPARFRRSS